MVVLLTACLNTKNLINLEKDKSKIFKNFRHNNCVFTFCAAKLQKMFDVCKFLAKNLTFCASKFAYPKIFLYLCTRIKNPRSHIFEPQKGPNQRRKQGLFYAS